jgi:hypothetical protein
MKNGKDAVSIHTTNGVFEFKLQRYCTKDRKATPSILARNPGDPANTYRSTGLEQKACHYATLMPYGTVSQMLEDFTGSPAMSGQEIENVVKKRAAVLSHKESEALSRVAETAPALVINTSPGIYDKTAPEVLVIADGIVVKEQKSERDCIPRDSKSFVSTTVIGVQRVDGTMVSLVESYDKEVELGLDAKLSATLQREYKTPTAGGLPVVAINDGAKDLRKLFLSAFGVLPLIILDWYHLCKKVRAYLSMSGLVKDVKCELTKQIILLLWNGKPTDVIELIRTTESERITWKDDLITYITKHKDEIIDYKKRKEVGKKIGSGYIESTVNKVVGRRQKSKGMSWSADGSHALAILQNSYFNAKPPLMMTA